MLAKAISLKGDFLSQANALLCNINLDNDIEFIFNSFDRYEQNYMKILNKIDKRLRIWNSDDFEYLTYPILNSNFGHFAQYDFIISNNKSSNNDDENENKKNFYTSFIPNLNDNEVRFANYTVNTINKFNKGPFLKFTKDIFTSFFNGIVNQVLNNFKDIKNKINNIFSNIGFGKLFENLDENSIENSNKIIKPYILPKLKENSKPWLINENDTYESFIIDVSYNKKQKRRYGKKYHFK